MEEKRDKNKTMAERLHNANVLPDGNLNSVGLLDVVLHNLESTGNADSEGVNPDTEDTSNNEENNSEEAP